MARSQRFRDDSLLHKLRRRKLSHVRAAGADALVAFVSDRDEAPLAVRDWLDRGLEQRWFPVEGGQLVKWPYQGQSPDPRHFRVEAGGWDHEHCSACSATIRVNQGCWITPYASFFLLCEGCYRRMKRLGKTWQPAPPCSTGS